MDRVRLICRMCLQCNDLVEIFSASVKTSGLLKRINVHLKQEVSKDDDLPEFICLQCIKIISDFDLFCTQVAENQAFLRKNFTVNFLLDVKPEPTENETELAVDERDETRLDSIVLSDSNSAIKEEGETSQPSFVCDEASNDSEQIVWHSDGKDDSLDEDTSCVGQPTYSSDNSEQNIPEHVRSFEQEYPKTLMKDGRYMVRRTKLVVMAQKFYLLKCQLCKGKSSRTRHKTISGLFRHYKRWHKDQGFVTCCDRKFRKRTEIVNHMIWHLQPSAFMCSVCGKRVTDPTYLVKHMKGHEVEEGTKNRKVRCDECGIKVLSDHFLEIHKNKIHNSTMEFQEFDINEPHPDFEGFPRSIMKNGEVAIHGDRLTNLVNKFYRFTCDMCPESETFPSFTVLLDHYKNVHSTIGYTLCCGIKIEKRMRLIHHMAQHLDPDAFKCHICGKMSSRPGKLKEHMMVHKSVEERWYFCPQCPKRYVTHVGLVKHMINHLPVEERKKFPCSTCGKIFYHRTNLNSHVKSVHIHENFICHVCGKKFDKVFSYKNHMERHNLERKQKTTKKCKPGTRKRPAIEEWRICPYCSEIFPTKRLLLQHAEFEHNFLHKCEHCNYSNNKFELYLRHLNEQHVLERNFVCNMCGSTYEYLYKLKEHMNTHTREKKYICQFCNKEYLSLSGFCRHGRENHAEEYKQLLEKKKEMKKSRKIQPKETGEEPSDDIDCSIVQDELEQRM